METGKEPSKRIVKKAPAPKQPVSENAGDKKKKTGKCYSFIDIVKIVIATAGVTSAVLIFFYEKLFIENYKLELEISKGKVADLQARVNHSDSTGTSLRTTLHSLTDAMTSYQINHHTSVSREMISRFADRIGQEITAGEALLNADPRNSQTTDAYNAWRTECISLLTGFDKELATSYAQSFNTLAVKLILSQFMQLGTNIADGVSVLKATSLYLKP